jgi:hypothetical protein
MQTLHASADIDAPAEQVWRIVTDFARYPEWNPFIVRASGVQRVGERLELTIKAPGVRAVTFRPRVLDVEPGRLIRWKGKLWVPGLFDGRHVLVVETLDGGRSRFTTHEQVSGILVPVLGKVMRASQQGFELMAEALSRRVAEQAGA